MAHVKPFVHFSNTPSHTHKIMIMFRIYKILEERGSVSVMLDNVEQNISWVLYYAFVLL